METAQIGVTQNNPYSLVGVTLSGQIGQYNPSVLSIQQELNRLGYNVPTDGILTDKFLNTLYTEQNKQNTAGIAAYGDGWQAYREQYLRDGQNYAFNESQTPLANTIGDQAAPLDPNAPSGHSAEYLADPNNQQFLNSTSPSGTSISTAQTGGSILSGQLSLNSTDTAGVKALQTFLNQNYNAGLTVDGKFGPLTLAAVKNYQTQNGLQADGIVGPLTMAKINGTGGGYTSTSNPNDSGGANGGSTGSPTVSGNTVTFNGQTYTTSSPEEASFLQNAIVPFLDQLKQQGMAINPDLNLGPEIIAKILTKAQATVHPQYSQQIENVKQDLARNVGRATDSYNSSVAGARQNFQDLLGNTRENYAGSGLAFSGQRGLGETNLANDENRSLASLSSNYGNTLSDYARTAESQLGTAGYNASGFRLPSSMAYSADLSGNGGFNSSGNVNMGYTPGAYALGSIPQSETAAALALRNQNVQQASNLKSAGLDYSSLYA